MQRSCIIPQCSAHADDGRWDHKCVSGFDRRRTYLSAFLFATETQQTIGL